MTEKKFLMGQCIVTEDFTVGESQMYFDQTSVEFNVPEWSGKITHEAGLLYIARMRAWLDECESTLKSSGASPAVEEEVIAKLYVQCRGMGSIRRCRVKAMVGGMNLEYHNFHTLLGHTFSIEPVFVLVEEDQQIADLWDGQCWNLEAVDQFVQRHSPFAQSKGV